LRTPPVRFHGAAEKTVSGKLRIDIAWFSRLLEEPGQKYKKG